MRKIMTAGEQEAKSLRNKRIMAIVFGLIMLFSTAGYAFMSYEKSGTATNGENTEYKGVSFEKTDYGFWKFNYGGKEYQTYYTPIEAANVSVSSDFSRKISDYYNQPIYLAGEPSEALSVSGGQEIMRNLNGIISRVNYACSSEDLNCTQDYAVKSCADSNMIIFKNSESNKSSVSQREKCAVITYASGDEEKAADAFVFALMGMA